MASIGYGSALIKIIAVLAVSGAVFASSGSEMTYAEKDCVRACCEGVGGTYEWEHNGCESPQADMLECADACREDEANSCPFSALMMFGLAGAAMACSSITSD